jgi:hypothetical protein
VPSASLRLAANQNGRGQRHTWAEALNLEASEEQPVAWPRGVPLRPHFLPVLGVLNTYGS